ncbi:MAG: hypothetical protein ACRD3W_17680, partial [Terriglobales bacterium]
RYTAPQSLVKDRYACFEQMLSLSQSKHIPLVVVNLPVAGLIRNEAPPAVMSVYARRMQDLCSQYEAAYVNMDVRDEFADSDFYDGMHLNARGGRKFFRDLADRLDEGNALASLYGKGSGVWQ